MAADRAQNLQDTFLNHVRKNKTPLTIFLVNGVKLQGVVTWFDNFCVLLRRDGHSQLVYKHAISTIMPVIRSSCSKAPRRRRPGKRSDWSRAAATRATDPAEPGAEARRPAARSSSSRALRPSGGACRALPSGTPAARLDEAVGLARAIDLDVAAEPAS